VNSDELRLQRGLAVLEQHCDNLLQVALKFVEAVALTVGARPAREVSDVEPSVGVALDYNAKASHGSNGLLTQSKDTRVGEPRPDVDGGGSFAPIAECQDLPDSATSCLWLAPGPPSGSALVRVAAEDTSGNSASDDSNAVFKIVSGTASVTVVSPNTNVKWRIGSRQTIKWTHNLGLSATFRIELDRDNDGSYEELIAAAAPASSTTKGSFAWTVTGPASATARVRVSWTGNPAVSDSSDVTFQIRPAPLRATARGAPMARSPT